MTPHVLDRPIWHALATRHQDFAEGGTRARRYVADVSPFAACEHDDPESLGELGNIVPEGSVTVLLQTDPCPDIAGTVKELVAPGVQMVARSVSPLENYPGVVDLGPEDAGAMLSLATLTKPGPFLPRTYMLGGFIGIRDEQGRLVAMAGERLKVDGFTEVSGVCTHPEARGRGYAGVLSRIVATRIASRGETPILHAWAANEPAIRLYRQLGFEHRRDMTVTVLRRA